jgi:hypothetical protein
LIEDVYRSFQAFHWIPATFVASLPRFPPPVDGAIPSHGTGANSLKVHHDIIGRGGGDAQGRPHQPCCHQAAVRQQSTARITLLGLPQDPSMLDGLRRCGPRMGQLLQPQPLFRRQLALM